MTIPIPPPELRVWVGPTDAADYDNLAGGPLLDDFGVPHDAYRSVFDFGCGCGRQARQMLLQTPRPARYLGIDIRRELVDWCRQHLSPVDPGFTFLHHDVYSPSYAPDNSLQLTQPLPAGAGEFSLVLANSVFTHLTLLQTEYYLGELARILAPGGVAFTTWLFFDRESFPVYPDVYTLYVSASDFSRAVLFDREWFLAAVRRAGLRVSRTIAPQLAGYQWIVFFERRTDGAADEFPLGEEGAEWLSGATLRPMAAPRLPHHLVEKLRVDREVPVASAPAGPAPLAGALVQLLETRDALAQAEAEIAAMRATFAWRIGRALTFPVRWIRERRR